VEEEGIADEGGPVKEAPAPGLVLAQNKELDPLNLFRRQLEVLQHLVQQFQHMRAESRRGFLIKS
jgi:hypothetical protein